MDADVTFACYSFERIVGNVRPLAIGEIHTSFWVVKGRNGIRQLVATSAQLLPIQRWLLDVSFEFFPGMIPTSLRGFMNGPGLTRFTQTHRG